MRCRAPHRLRKWWIINLVPAARVDEPSCPNKADGIYSLSISMSRSDNPCSCIGSPFSSPVRTRAGVDANFAIGSSPARANRNGPVQALDGVLLISVGSVRRSVVIHA